MSVVGWSVSVAELVQKTDIIFIERPDIVNAVAEHRNPVNAHTECIPGHLFGIEIHSPEDVGIHHAGSQYFKPLPLFTASPPDKLGRASCRERVYTAVRAGRPERR